jgi:glucose/arabinose dehydrogenase
MHRRQNRTPVIAVAMTLWAMPAAAQDQQESASTDGLDALEDWKSADVQITGHVLEPKQLEPNVPDGFEIGVFARDLINPRMLAVAEDGTVYATRREVGDVVMLRDEDGDGRADVQQTVATRPMMHGIAIDGDTVYLVTVADIYKAQIKDDGSFGPLERIVDDLPDGGQHPNRMVVVGPHVKLYVAVGSTCNACGETN